MNVLTSEGDSSRRKGGGRRESQARGTRGTKRYAHRRTRAVRAWRSEERQWTVLKINQYPQLKKAKSPSAFTAGNRSCDHIASYSSQRLRCAVLRIALTGSGSPPMPYEGA